MLVLKKDVQRVSVPSLSSPTLSLAAGPLHHRTSGHQFCPGPSTVANPSGLALPAPTQGYNPGTSSPPSMPCPLGPTKRRPLGPLSLGGKGQQGSHSTTDAFIGKTYNQASRGRVLAEWVTFFPLSLGVFKEQEGGGGAIPVSVTTPAAKVYALPLRPDIRLC